MLKIFMLLLNVAMLFSCTNNEVKVISFNIRYDNPSDNENSWTNRKEYVTDFIIKEDADFIGMQEVLPHQYDHIKQALKGYKSIYRTREVDENSGEGGPIFYNPSKWEVVSSKTIWLSDTPDVEGSNTWGAACNRIVTYAIFNNIKSSKKVAVLNTHFDHISVNARLRSANLISELISSEFKNISIVLTGDFNAFETTPSIKALKKNLEDSYRSVNSEIKITDGTYNGWKQDENRRIDYIFTSTHFTTNSSYVVRDYPNKDIYISDHYPVVSTVTYK